jgi:predicted PurR-regulated permease PerM
MTTPRTAHRFFLGLIAVSAVLLATVVRPLAGALITAIALTTVLQPLHHKLSTTLHRRPRLTAAVLLCALALLVMGPVVALSAFMVNETTQGVRFVRDTVRSQGVAGLVERLPAPMRSVVNEGLARLPAEAGDDIDATVNQQVNAQGSNAASLVGGIVAATGSFLFQLTMMMIALFFLLVDGLPFIGWLDSVSPLRRGQTHELLAEFKKVSYSIIVSTLITAAIQAIAALIGYLFSRVPHPLFFMAVTFVLAFIPAVGAAVVCQAAALLLLMTAHPYAALFLSLWGLLVVGVVDNIAKPMLMKNDMELHPAVVFFALLGGLSAFGAVGLLIGPLAVSLFVTLLRMYQRDFVDDDARNTQARARPPETPSSA